MQVLMVNGIMARPPSPTANTNNGPSVSSPSRGGVFFSAPTSPARSPSQSLLMEADPASGASASPGGSSSDFEFTLRFSEFEGGAVSADELFWNGQIRPMMPSARFDKPQVLCPLIDSEEAESLDQSHMDEDEDEDEDRGGRGRDRGLVRDKSRHRRTRSLSPQWKAPQEPESAKLQEEDELKASTVKKGKGGSKRWISLKDFLYRSKSEGRDHTREKHWVPLSFSTTPSKPQPSSSKKEGSSAEKTKPKNKNASAASAVSRNINGHVSRKVPVSAHELHYTAYRAQAEDLRHKTYLPYKQGLFGWLGFTSKTYTYARTLHPALS